MSSAAAPSNQIIDNLPTASGQPTYVGQALNTRNVPADSFCPVRFEALGHDDADHGWTCSCSRTIATDSAVDADRQCLDCGELLASEPVTFDDLEAL